MPFLYSLCSSSKGNSTYIGNKKSGVLIDVGIGIRGFANQLNIAGISSDAVKAIFITHEHTDHVKGLAAIGKRLNVPIYGSKETLTELINKDQIDQNAKLYEINKTHVDIAGLHIGAFSTPHDTAKSIGFKINTDCGKSICYATDLGNVTQTVFNNMYDSNLVFIESNYDENMLTAGPYPWSIKKRILSSNGHLSNFDCAECVCRLIEGNTKKFVLGHLSENNNRPELAYMQTVNELLKKGAAINEDYTLNVAPKTNIGNIVEI